MVHSYFGFYVQHVILFVNLNSTDNTIDADLSSKITKTSLYHLRNSSKIHSFISQRDSQTLVHAFVTSRLDCCNALFTGLPTKSIQLQLIQNAK